MLAYFIFFPLFDEWCCIPVLLVVWPETSSTGVCRQLDRARSWCWDEDLWVASLWLIFPGVWDFLLVQRFGLRAPTTGAQARPLASEPRSHNHVAGEVMVPERHGLPNPWNHLAGARRWGPELPEGPDSGLRSTGWPGLLRVRARPSALPAPPRVPRTPVGLDRRLHPGFMSEAPWTVF